MSKRSVLKAVARCAHQRRALRAGGLLAALLWAGAAGAWAQAVAPRPAAAAAQPEVPPPPNVGAASAPSAAHPAAIVGLWANAVSGLPQGLCMESYRYRPDGTGEDASGESRTSSQWAVVGAADAQGFYRMTVRLQHNGKPDCSGNMPPVGRAVLLHVRPHPSGNWMEMCGGGGCTVLWRMQEPRQ